MVAVSDGVFFSVVERCVGRCGVEQCEKKHAEGVGMDMDRHREDGDGGDEGC